MAPSGVSYELLQLAEGTHKMALSTLQKIAELADAGVKIKGVRPVGSPSRADDPQAFQKLADEVWTKSNVGTDIMLEIPKDVEVTDTDHEIRFRHRVLENGHLYWLNNRSAEPTDSKISFRVTGKQPKKWDPQTGEISEVSYSIENGKTWVELSFTSWDAYFILFIGDADQNSLSLPEVHTEDLMTVDGPWEVSFQENRGAPASATFETLQSWTDNDDENIKHFSGTATYTNTFEITGLEEDVTYLLDLGDVKNVAEVFINDKKVGTAWKTPFTLDISNVVRVGENILVIKLTNTWVNRLIGDATKNQEEKITFTTMPFYRGNEDLLPSGLFGDVKILMEVQK